MELNYLLAVCVNGRDDLRQDAVMQQVFGMVNTLLDKETDTAHRNLHVRTYKVRVLQGKCAKLLESFQRTCTKQVSPNKT